MKSKLFKYLTVFVAIVLIISISLIGYLYLSTRNSDVGHLKLTGLMGKVTVTKDQYGVPHIEAFASDNDAIFVLGFVHAQDRLWQMEFQRHVAQGSLSEIFGSATLEKDKYLRIWGFYRAATESWSALDSTTQGFIHSYTDGVNAFLAQGNLPLEFKLLRYKPKPWTNIDSIAWQKMLAWDLQHSWEDKLVNAMIAKKFGKEQIKVLQPPYPETSPTVLSEEDLKQSGISVNFQKKDTGQNKLNNFKQVTTFQDYLKTSREIRSQLGFNHVAGKGSNSWALAGTLTKSGKPILASDPHLAFSSPILWYLAEIKGPQLHVTGATIPGIPFVVIGHNQFIGWGITDSTIDAQDLYIEAKDAKLETIVEVIKVRDEPDFHLTVQISKHGPLINNITKAGEVGDLVALKWTALLPGDTTIKSFLNINYAKNWQEFTDALRWQVAPSLNLIYADINGNIGYYLSGKVPMRVGWSGELPIQPNQNYEWSGFIPFEQLPHVYNPVKGYIASANNKIVSDNYPYQLTFRWAVNPYRIERILDLIEENPAATITDVAKTQIDTKSYLWNDLRPILIKTKPLDESSKKALKELSTWNGIIDTKSVSATIFAYWYKELSKLMPYEIKSRLHWPEPQFLKQQLLTNGLYCQSKTIKTCNDFLSKSLQTSILLLTKQFGASQNNWQWGKVHRAIFKELGLGEVKQINWLFNRSLSTSGGDDTVNPGSYDIDTFNQTVGAGYRQVIDFDNLDHSLYVLALGQSSNIFNSHYDDQLSLWRKGEYLTMGVDLKNARKVRVLQFDAKKYNGL